MSRDPHRTGDGAEVLREAAAKMRADEDPRWGAVAGLLEQVAGRRDDISKMMAGRSEEDAEDVAAANVAGYAHGVIAARTFLGSTPPPAAATGALADLVAFVGAEPLDGPA